MVGGEVHPGFGAVRPWFGTVHKESGAVHPGTGAVHEGRVADLQGFGGGGVIPRVGGLSLGLGGNP